MGDQKKSPFETTNEVKWRSLGDYFEDDLRPIIIVEHEGRNCAIPGRFKIFPLLRLNFSLRENSKHITSVDIAIAERGNRSGYPERSGK